MQAVIYARYSSDKQDEASIDAQVRACREYADKNGYSVTRVYADEAISGKGSKTLLRKQYQAMVKDSAKKQFDVILVHKYDRVARNVGEHVNLELKLSEHNVALIAVAQDFGSSKEAKIMKTMMWALSEYYIDNLSEESKKGHREVALKGLHNGGYAPFGYNVVNQVYVINELESEYVRKMFLCARDGTGFKTLITEMQTAGIVGKRGKPIKYAQIYEILRNEKYTGLYKYSPTECKMRSLRREKPDAIKIDNALPQIIGKALFVEVQNIMSERKHSGQKANYLCSGLVYCGNCGAKMHGSTNTRKGHSYRIFSCSKSCGIGVISMDTVDESVKTYLNEVLSSENQQLIEDSLREYAKMEKSRAKVHNEKMQAQISEKTNQIESYMNTLGSGILPKEIIEDVGLKIVKLKAEINELKETPVPKDISVMQIRDWLGVLKSNLDDPKTIKLLIERIDVKKTGISITSTLIPVLGNLGCGSRI